MIVACLKWVDRRPEVDPITGAVHTDARTSGLSAADASALEWALRAAQAWGDEVLALTAGPDAAEGVAREALAAGATRAARVALAPGAPSDSVASALAGALERLDAGPGPLRLVCCGDHSLDRGSGSVPAFLAARLGAAQVLGLLSLEFGVPGSVEAMRRLDGGRREQVRAAGAVVVSVEGGTAPLRRGSLAATLSARRADIAVIPAPTPVDAAHRPLRPFRPRPRALDAPSGDRALDRVRALTAATGATGGRAQPVVLTPAEAAERILTVLRARDPG
ncbi:MAG: mycofactocin-associated electron transfer flavoprotein beta subunit [Acidimicrobiales bacterium]